MQSTDKNESKPVYDCALRQLGASGRCGVWSRHVSHVNTQASAHKIKRIAKLCHSEKCCAEANSWRAATDCSLTIGQ